MPTSGFSKLIIIIFVVLVLLIIGGFWLFWTETQPPGQKLPLPLQQSWTHEKALEEALAQNEPSICERINESYVLQDFVVSAEQARNNCKVAYAIEKQDLSYCMSLSDTRESNNWSLRDGCLQPLAKKLQRPELCDQMPSVKDPDYGQTWLKQCKEASASDVTLLPEGDIVIPASYKQCSVDSDCVFVAEHCGYCTCGTVINKNFEQTYKNQFESLCTDYSGAYCDLQCRESTAKCLDGICRVSY
ncbi:hypothetical protein IID24_02100 [Patescibacteria group bacterium]|nr:hypothetical protein [Patescibacteria group bacterium]